MSTAPEQDRTVRTADVDEHYEDKPEGPISAAIIAGGIGAFALGLLTTLTAMADTNQVIRLRLLRAIRDLGA
jgi:hypothetical protein